MPTVFPVKCFTCGNPISNKFLYYRSLVMQEKKKLNINNDITYLTTENNNKQIEGKILDKLKIRKYCCRTKFICYPDFE